MSVSIITQPAIVSLNSANNPSMFIVASTLSGSTDFQYKGDIRVNLTTKCTLTSFPDPVYGYGVFDFSSLTKSFVTYDFPGTASEEGGLAVHQALNSFVLVDAIFREEYTSGSTFFSPTGGTQSNSAFYINSSLPFADSVTSPSLDAYTAATNHVGKFLQTQPAIGNKIAKDAPKTLRQWLYYFSARQMGGTYASVHVTTFTSAGAFVGHYRLTNTVTGANSQEFYASVGYPQLAALPSSGFTTISGSTTLMGATVASYEVVLAFSTTSTASPASETVTFTIKDECTKFTDTYSVYWLNILGGFDSFRFAKKNILSQNLVQASYKKIQGKLNADGSYTRKTYDPSVVNYYTEVTNQIQLNSDFLTDDQANYLKGLFSSPVIFIEDSNGIIQAATIDSSITSYTINRRINQRLYSLQLLLNLSSTDTRQLQ